jgi:hypothetical protein
MFSRYVHTRSVQNPIKFWLKRLNTIGDTFKRMQIPVGFGRTGRNQKKKKSKKNNPRMNRNFPFHALIAITTT